MEPQNLFPKDFLWGASTASHQVEGGTVNQWSVWELAHAQQLAKTAKKRLGWLPVWKEIKAEAEDPSNYVSGHGVDHFRRYRDDFDLLKKLNLNAFRFGIEWARLEPTEGQWDEAALAHYHGYIKELKKRGIEPILNIWHWTVPIWFDDRGGFKKRANIKYFERFVQKIAEAYADEVTYIITLNEPNVFASFGYFNGQWPPQEKNPISFGRVYWHLVLAHRRAYRILKRRKSSLQIGIAQQLANIQAKRPHNILDEVVTKWMRYAWNWWFYRRIRHQQDFVGFNYYFTDYYKWVHKLNPEFPLNDLGWYMEPEGLYPLLLRAWSHHKKPLIITENGVADGHDRYRRWWLEATILAMERAISEGVEIKGYFHWSLMDNFEWSYGWWPKFGLLAVNRQHGMQRSIRPSAKWFGERVKELRSLDD